jgi:hypothetical protein
VPQHILKGLQQIGGGSDEVGVWDADEPGHLRAIGSVNSGLT